MATDPPGFSTETLSSRRQAAALLFPDEDQVRVPDRGPGAERQAPKAKIQNPRRRPRRKLFIMAVLMAQTP
jgi:hypothetical protein